MYTQRHCKAMSGIVFQTMESKLLVLLAILILASNGAGDGINDLWSSGESGSAHSEDGPSGNLTFTCAERNIMTSGETLGNYSIAVINTVIAFRITYFTLLFCSGVSLNTFVLYLVIKYKKLRTLSFGIALQIVVINILLAIFIFIPTVVTTAAGRWVFGKHVCVFTGFVSFNVTLIRTGLMFVFVVDRFLSVFFPFFYPKHKVKITVSFSVLSSVLIVLLSIVNFPGILDCYTYTTTFNSCYASATCSEHCSTFSTIIFIVVGLPSTVVPLVLFTALYCKARRLNKNTAAPAVAVAGETVSDEARKSEWRATVTFFLLFISLFALTVPTTALQIVIAQISRSGSVVLPPAWFVVQALSGGVISLLVLTDPIVIMRNKDVWEILSEVKTNLIRKCCPNFVPNAEQ